MTGYSDVELDAIQHRWELTFPPDLIALLRERRGLIAGRGAFAHRYLPAVPCEAGNPVFSAYQSDVIS